MTTETAKARAKFRFSSSITDDVWHPKSDARSYEWWYFDALSDDGRDSVVIIFLDNFVFSPRYNRKNGDGLRTRIPAIAFFYYRDGRPMYRAINEYSESEFEAGTESPRCRIGDSRFEYRATPYGSGYMISISGNVVGRCRIEATFEWLDVEGGFRESETDSGAHHWNLAVPRADVSGKVTVTDRAERSLETITFRGTGYHDHNHDDRWLPATVTDWQWGRAHFNDCTAVFYRYNEGDGEPVSKLLTVRGGELSEHDALYQPGKLKRDIFGLKFPQSMKFVSETGETLSVEHLKTIDSSFFYLRFLSEMTLIDDDGKERRATGITEFLAPRPLRYRWLDWLTDMCIGRNGRSPRIP